MEKKYYLQDEDTRGVMAIEACVGLTLFMMLMFALYSFIVLFMAQSLIGHALTESSQSLALETYGTSKLDKGWNTSAIVVGLAKLVTTDPDSNGTFVSDTKWTSDPDAVKKMAKQRFAAYLAGGEEDADAMLRTLGVKDGLDGLDFSKTAVSGSDLTISVHYNIGLLVRLDALHLGDFETTQSVCARMWAG